jgi:hypothetical protein
MLGHVTKLDQYEITAFAVFVSLPLLICQPAHLIMVPYASHSQCVCVFT